MLRTNQNANLIFTYTFTLLDVTNDENKNSYFFISSRKCQVPLLMSNSCYVMLEKCVIHAQKALDEDYWEKKKK